MSDTKPPSGATGPATSSVPPPLSTSPRPRSASPVSCGRPAEHERRVKVVGSGHSFTGIALTDGRLVKLDRYQKVLSIDRDSMRVTLQAGIKLARLNEELEARNLAMPNLGDINYQSIAGAISTTTHGTARDLGGIARDVVGMRLITGGGEVIECSEDVEPEVFHCARVGLAALGVISTVTLQCVKAFNLRALETPMCVDEALADLDKHIRENDHFEFFWVPSTGWALTKRNNRTEDPLQTRGRWREFRDDILLRNVAFGAVCRIGRWRPQLIPRVAKMVPSPGRTVYVDRSYKVFSTPRTIRFYEMEYAIEAFDRVRDYAKRSGLISASP